MSALEEGDLRLLIKARAKMLVTIAEAAPYTDLKRDIERMAEWVHALGPLGKAEAERK